MGAVAALVLAAFGAAVPAQAQNGDDAAEIEAALVSLIDAINAGDGDTAAALFADGGLAEFVGEPDLTPEEARAALDELIAEVDGTVELIDIRDVTVEGDTGSAIIEIRVFDAFGFVDRADFTRIDGVWLVTGWEEGVEQPEQPEQPEIPEGYETVHVGLLDYAFDFDLSELSVGDNVAFEAENLGEEPHELVLVMVPPDLDLEAALMSDEEPEGIVEIAFTIANPGQTGIGIAEDPLAAGRYVMVCFFETEDGTPHWQLGMVEDFTLQEAETPTPEPTEPPATPTPSPEPTEPPATPTTEPPAPPATGSGLADGGSSAAGLLGLGLAAIGLGGAVATRRAVRR